MQTQARQEGVTGMGWIPIEWICQDRATDMFQMGSNLVGATGEGRGFYQAVTPQTTQNLEFCDGRFPFHGVNDCAVPAISIQEEWRGDCFFLPSWFSDNEGMVPLGSSMFLKLGVQVSVGIRAARQHDDPAGISIQSVYNPQPPEPRLQD
jgi:hypothetical protein